MTRKPTAPPKRPSTTAAEAGAVKRTAKLNDRGTVMAPKVTASESGQVKRPVK
jgi:hypothetical protein